MTGLTERDAGAPEPHPARPAPADQAWFWTPQWQEGEREVNEHVAAGRETVHETGADLLAHLDSLDALQ
jgi:hypothetical protein